MASEPMGIVEAGYDRVAERGDVLGVDISARQLELARRRVPAARFRKGDMADIEFPAAGFDAVTAFYSIAHVPRQRHGDLFERISTWLRPGGYLLAAAGLNVVVDETVTMREPERAATFQWIIAAKSP